MLIFGQYIQQLRKKKRLSQEGLAKKARIARTTIARLESGAFKSLSVENLQAVAKALEVDWKVFCGDQNLTETVTSRGHVNHTHFSMDYPDDGFRISSLIPRTKEYFLGKMEVAAHKTIPSSKLPHAEQLCLHMIEGKFVLNYANREYVLKIGDCFAFPGSSEYDCYNPDLLKTASCLLITCPSFIPL